MLFLRLLRTVLSARCRQVVTLGNSKKCFESLFLNKSRAPVFHCLTFSYLFNEPWFQNVTVLKNFRTVWQPSLQVDLGENLVLHSVQPPASGAILAYVLNTLKYYYIRDGDLSPLIYHRVPILSKLILTIVSKSCTIFISLIFFDTLYSFLNTCQ